MASVTWVTDGRSDPKHTGREHLSAQDMGRGRDAGTCQLSRREFVRAAMAAAAAGSGIACSTIKSPWRFLSVHEAKILAAICDRIIPPDQDPGAAWAGVVNYIDRQLCGSFRHLRQTYRWGIAGVDESSRTLYGASFVDLVAAKQVELLTLLEEGRAPGDRWKQVPSPQFFGLLVDHTMQGFYGDPRHGGNREWASWKMLGVPYPPIRGRLHYDLSKL